MCGRDAISNEMKEASSPLQSSCGARRSSIDFMRLIENNRTPLFLYLKRPKHLCNWMAEHLTAVMDRIIIDMFYWFAAVRSHGGALCSCEEGAFFSPRGLAPPIKGLPSRGAGQYTLIKFWRGENTLCSSFLIECDDGNLRGGEFWYEAKARDVQDSLKHNLCFL